MSTYRIQQGYDKEEMRNFRNALHETHSQRGIFHPLDFTLSTSWGEAAEKAGYATALRYAISQKGAPVGLFQGLVHKRLSYRSLLAGSTSGSGVVMLDDSLDLMNYFLLQILKKEKFSTLSIYVPTAPNIRGFSQEANYTHYIHLDRDMNELFQNMEKKTRNRVRKAQKLGVKVVFSNSIKALREAYNVIYSTALMKSISAYPWSYILNLHECFQGNDCESVVALGYAGDDAVQSAAHLIGFDKKIVLWQAGSTDKGYKLNVGSLVQADIIEYSKNAGYLIYDMGGTDPKNPIYAGIHRFKSGFGGSLMTNAVISKSAFYVPLVWRVYNRFTKRKL